MRIEKHDFAVIIVIVGKFKAPKNPDCQMDPPFNAKLNFFEMAFLENKNKKTSFFDKSLFSNIK
jgi:hypothetical protein